MIFSGALVSLNDTLNQCCHLGSQWATEGTNCTEYDQSLDEGIPVELLHVCLSTVEICCVRQQRHLQCIGGQSAARRDATCRDALVGVPEPAYYRDCCESCKIGLMTAQLVPQCDLLTLGSPWQEIYAACCEEAAAANTANGSNPCSSAQCHQICVPTGHSYTCKCTPGFVLTHDGHSCRVANATVPTCDDGYTWDSNIDQCTGEPLRNSY